MSSPGEASRGNITSSCLILVLLIILLIQSIYTSFSQINFTKTHQRLHTNLDYLPDDYEDKVDVNYTFPNPRLKRAYIALDAWKYAIYSDPLEFTGNWVGPNVCEYKGVYCAPALDDPNVEVVAGVDLNGADIAGSLPIELGLLTDIALFHINSNRFCGVIPNSFSKLTILHELDISNNRFVGPFPNVVLSIPSLKFLDLRFNEFEGKLPLELFNKDLDGLFLNDNRFVSYIPENMGNSSASVIVLANNNFIGCIPSSIGNMRNTINEILFTNNKLTGCVPHEMGLLGNMSVLDISGNGFEGTIPDSFGDLKAVEQMDLSGNKLSGTVGDCICKLSSLRNLSLWNNYFIGEDKLCGVRKELEIYDDFNCFDGRSKQRAKESCGLVVGKAVDCDKAKCGGGHGGDGAPESAPVAVTKHRYRSPPPPYVQSPPPLTNAPPPAAGDVYIPPIQGSNYGAPPPPQFQG